MCWCAGVMGMLTSTLVSCAGKVVRRMEELHAKPIHTVAMPASSAFATLPQDAHDLFVTSALDGAVQVLTPQLEKVVTNPALIC